MSMWFDIQISAQQHEEQDRRHEMRQRDVAELLPACSRRRLARRRRASAGMVCSAASRISAISGWPYQTIAATVTAKLPVGSHSHDT